MPRRRAQFGLAGATGGQDSRRACRDRALAAAFAREHAGQPPRTPPPRPRAGQAGIQVGNACWELYCLEHG